VGPRWRSSGLDSLESVMNRETLHAGHPVPVAAPWQSQLAWQRCDGNRPLCQQTKIKHTVSAQDSIPFPTLAIASRRACMQVQVSRHADLTAFGAQSVGSGSRHATFWTCCSEHAAHSTVHYGYTINTISSRICASSLSHSSLCLNRGARRVCLRQPPTTWLSSI
jgi:hypothetical protein